MFATLRTQHNSLLVERASGYASFSACNTCRAKKLKCTGEASGCRRCLLHQTKCEYNDTAGRRKVKAPKGSSPQTRHTNHAALPSPPPSSAEPATLDPTIYEDFLRDATGRSESSGAQATTETTAAVCSPPSSNAWVLEGFDSFEEEERFGNNDIEALLGSSADASQMQAMDSPFAEDALLDSTGTLIPTGPCQCISVAISLLETLALDDYETRSSSTSHELHGRKRALTTCIDLFTCHSCSRTSQFLMLMIQLCGKAVRSYSRLAEKLQMSTGDNVRVGEYEASSEETLLVLSSLAVHQLETWIGLLTRLLNRCRALGLTRHMAMVMDLDSDVRTQVLKFRRSSAVAR